jgi:hypothetical protein
MGMFDYIICKYPLPIEGLHNQVFQTKSMDEDPSLEHYEIREDGTLWREEYEIEDRSDPSAKGMERFIGMGTRVNLRWFAMNDFAGEIRFYTVLDDKDSRRWVEMSAIFENGRTEVISRIKDEKLPLLDAMS